MSDEDRVGDKFVRHPPAFRSSKVQMFIEKLDARLQKKGSSKPRLARVLGLPRKLPLPRNAKQWTVHAESIPEDPAAEVPEDDSCSPEVATPEQVAQETSDSEFSAGSSSDSETY